ncbi:MAG: hypothetical protein ACHQ4J_12695 [Candidatus Binatia bacterium]
MGTVRYVEAALWLLNLAIYGCCIWLWMRPEPSGPSSKGWRAAAQHQPRLAITRRVEYDLEAG